jgi:6-hydroxynicotinate 3-monooxygenase
LFNDNFEGDAMNGMRQPRIAIVGAGMGGVAAAAIMHRMGLNVELYEQAEQFARLGAGIQVSPNVAKVLRWLGVEDDIQKIACRPKSLVSRVAETAEISYEFMLGDKIEAQYNAPYLLTHRADLHRVMCSAFPINRVYFGKKLIGLDQRGQQIELRFADGTASIVDAVIGADGVHSKIREHLLGPESPRYSGNVAYRSVFPASVLGDLQVDDCAKWWAADRHIVIYYLDRDRKELYFVTGVPEPNWKTESWVAKGTLEELCEAFKDFHPTVRKIVGASQEVHKWALIERSPLPKWCEGRIALLGDACHPMLPHLAQGAGMAIEDAAVLARCIYGSGSEGFEGAFKLYESLRKARTSRVQKESNENTFFRHGVDGSWLYGYDVWSEQLGIAA